MFKHGKDFKYCGSINTKIYEVEEYLFYLTVMDQISIKTPNPKCRLYRCLLEFVDCRYSQSFSGYRGSPIHTVCNGGGGVSGGSQI